MSDENPYAPEDLGTRKVGQVNTRRVPDAHLSVAALRHLGAEPGDRVVYLPDGDDVRVQVIDAEDVEESPTRADGETVLVPSAARHRHKRYHTDSECRKVNERHVERLLSSLPEDFEECDFCKGGENA